MVPLALCLLYTTSAVSQTASQITKPDYRPSTPEPDRQFDIPDISEGGQSEGAENIHITVSAFDIDGEAPVTQSEGNDPTLYFSKLIGKKISIYDLYKACRDLEKKYNRDGFILVRVVLPAQKISGDGIVKIKIIDGFIEDVNLDAVPESVRQPVKSVIAPLINQKSLRISLVERQLLIAGDIPGIKIESTLVRGNQAGGSILIIKAMHAPKNMNVRADNSLSRSLNSNSLGVGLIGSSLLFMGEQIYLQIITDPSSIKGYSGDYPVNRTYVAGFIFPIGHKGLSFNAEAIEARATPRHDADDLGVSSQFTRYALSLNYPIVRSYELNVNGEARLDIQTERVSVFEPLDAGLSLDKTRVLRLNLNVFRSLEDEGYLQLTTGLSFGLDILGARTRTKANDDLPLSRFGADARFEKLEATLSWSRPVALRLQSYLRLSGQTAFNKPLLRSEQFSLAGSSALSGFDTGLLQGDRGFSLRHEVSRDFSIPVSWGTVRISPYTFWAIGSVDNERLTTLERNLHARSLGMGLKLRVARRSVPGSSQLNIEFAESHRSDAPKVKSRLNISINILY